MMRKVTVFGGSGFLGRHLVRRLASNGWEVRIACRDAETAALLKTAGDVGQVVPWPTDITVPAQVVTAVEGVDAVISLVGILYGSGRYNFDAVHHLGAANVAEAARAAGARKLVHVSAIGADEASESEYARTKAQGEKAVQGGFPDATILRPSVVFGPEDNFFNMFAGIARLTPVMPVYGCPVLPKISFGEGGLSIDFFGDGGTKFQPVYVGDVADAIMTALTSADAAGKTYELGGPRVYSFKQLMELLLEVTERRRILAPVPFTVAEFQALFLERLPKPLLTRDQVTLLKSDNVVTDGALTFADLGLEPVTAESILPTYLHRFRTPAHQHLQKA